MLLKYLDINKLIDIECLHKFELLSRNGAIYYTDKNDWLSDIYVEQYLTGLLELLEKEHNLLKEQKQTDEIWKKTDLEVHNEDLSDLFRIQYHEIPEALSLFVIDVESDELKNKILSKVKEISVVVHNHPLSRKQAEDYAKYSEKTLK